LLARAQALRIMAPKPVICQIYITDLPSTVFGIHFALFLGFEFANQTPLAIKEQMWPTTINDGPHFQFHTGWAQPHYANGKLDNPQAQEACGEPISVIDVVLFFNMLGLFWPIFFQSSSSPCRGVGSNSKSIGSVRRFASLAFEMVCALGLFIRQKLIANFPYMISAAHTICHSYHPESITCTEIALDVSNVKSTINKGGNTRSILLDHRGRVTGMNRRR